jgi:hypothetical protein
LRIRQFADAAGDGVHVLAQRHFTHGGIVGVHIARVRVERDLGVDHQVLVLRQRQHDVRAAPAFFGVEADFAAVVLAFAQARAIEHVAQHQFAPVALHLGLALERHRQAMRLFGDLPVQFLQLAQFGAQRCLLLDVLGVDLLHLHLELGHAFAQRIDDLTQAGFVVLGETLALFFEDLAGQRLELVGEFVLRLGQQRDLRGGLRALGLERRAHLSEVFPGRVAREGGRFRRRECFAQLLFQRGDAQDLFLEPGARFPGGLQVGGQRAGFAAELVQRGIGETRTVFDGGELLRALRDVDGQPGDLRMRRGELLVRIAQLLFELGDAAGALRQLRALVTRRIQRVAPAFGLELQRVVRLLRLFAVLLEATHTLQGGRMLRLDVRTGTGPRGHHGATHPEPAQERAQDGRDTGRRDADSTEFHTAFLR